MMGEHLLVQASHHITSFARFSFFLSVVAVVVSDAYMKHSYLFILYSFVREVYVPWLKVENENGNQCVREKMRF